MAIIGSRCFVRYAGKWIMGTITEHSVKNDYCVIDLGKFSIKVNKNKVRLYREEDYN